jgi:Fe-S cluster assembly ATPase SufC
MPNSIIIGDDAYDVEEGFIIFEQRIDIKQSEPERRSKTQEIKSLASLILENFKSNK